MTVDELRAECQKARANRKASGLSEDDAHLILVIPRKTVPKNWDRVRVMGGVYGRCVGTEPGDGGGGVKLIIDVKVVDIEWALAGIRKTGG